MQKTILMIVAVVIVVGCGKKQSTYATPEVEGGNLDVGEVELTYDANAKQNLKPEDVIGTYTLKRKDEEVLSPQKFIFLKNGIRDGYVNGKKLPPFEVKGLEGYTWDAEWFIRGSEIWVEEYVGKSIYIIEQNGDLTEIGRRILNFDVDIHDIEDRITYKKIKSGTKETTPKGNKNNNSATKPVKVLKKADVVGSYEAGLGGIIFRFVLLESGVVENYFNGIKEPEDAKWKIQGAEVHIEKGKSDDTVIVNKIEPNGDLTVFARIRNGKREDFQKGTYKKIQSPKATPS